MDETGNEFEDWEMVNGLVLSWIINGVSSQIASTLIHTETAYETWAKLQKMYKQKNAPKTSQLWYEINTLIKSS